MKRKLNNKGFTLIEILAAVALLSIVAFPLVKSFLDSFKFQAKSQIKTEANKVIEYVTEQLKNETYSEFKFEDGTTVENKLKNWAKTETETTLDTFKIDSLRGVNLTSPYEVTIEKISSSEVQKGGIGTPNEYDVSITIGTDGKGSSQDNTGALQVSYIDNGNTDKDFEAITNGTLEMNVLDDTKDFYTIKIESNADISNISVKKNTTKTIKVYKKENVKLSMNATAGGAAKQNVLETINLGNKDSIEDEKEFLCEARISAKNVNDDSIFSSMNVTFSVFIENEE